MVVAYSFYSEKSSKIKRWEADHGEGRIVANDRYQ